MYQCVCVTPIDCCDLWYVIRFAYITVGLDSFVSQRGLKSWLKRFGFKVMDVVLLICGEAGQQGSRIPCFKCVRSAVLHFNMAPSAFTDGVTL